MLILQPKKKKSKEEKKVQYHLRSRLLIVSQIDSVTLAVLQSRRQNDFKMQMNLKYQIGSSFRFDRVSDYGQILCKLQLPLQYNLHHSYIYWIQGSVRTCVVAQVSVQQVPSQPLNAHYPYGQHTSHRIALRLQ